jgi:hypothetical protein
MNGMNFKLASEQVRTSQGATVTGISAMRIDDWTLTRGAKVQAIIKKGGKWQAPEDWSMFPFKAFCRELKDERIEELVIILSAGDTSRKDFSPQGQPPMLYATDVICGPGIFQADVTCQTDDGDHKSINVDNVEYKSTAFGPGRGNKSDDAVAYSPLERGYQFQGGSVNVGTWSIGNKDVDSGGKDVTAAGLTGMEFSTVNFATQGENGYQAYDFSGSISGLNYSFTYTKCDCPGQSGPWDCSFNADFALKSSFDEKTKKYTRHLTGTMITGPGTDFSDDAASTLSLGTRKPADTTCECGCPGITGRWTCLGSWSLTSTPEP